MLKTIIIVLLVWIVVAFIAGVWVGKKFKKWSEPVSESLPYLSTMEKMLAEQARSDRQNQLKSNRNKEP